MNCYLSFTSLTWYLIFRVYILTNAISMRLQLQNILLHRPRNYRHPKESQTAPERCFNKTLFSVFLLSFALAQSAPFYTLTLLQTLITFYLSCRALVAPRKKKIYAHCAITCGVERAENEKSKLSRFLLLAQKELSSHRAVASMRRARDVT